MRIGVLRVYFHLPDSHSLKDKRRVLKSLKDRLINQFNVSVAEIGSNDKIQAAELGLASVSNEKAHLEKRMAKIIDFIEDEGDEMVVLEANLEFL